MKTDYPELEGKEVTIFGTKAIVSGCNYHIGISIENKGHYFLCLNGKSSPLYKTFSKHITQYIYRKLFHLIVKQIQKGEIDTLKLRIFFKENGRYFGNNPSAAACPFAQ